VAPSSSSRFELERRSTGEGTALHLSGTCRLADAPLLWKRLAESAGAGEALTVDLSELEQLDGACAALLFAWTRDVRASGGDVELVGARAGCREMLELYRCPVGRECGPAPRLSIGLFDQVGRVTIAVLRSLRDVFGFVGDLIVNLRRAILDRRSINWRDVPHLLERAGADGAPIVLLINFLVGLIVALQSAYQLEKFGANVFVADAVGLSMTRELGPLMTAIVVAGRSGAAYAAELGTMRVNQEIDALWTLGLDPYRFLVFPRLVAMAVAGPLLTLGSVIVGILGGLLVAISVLDLSALAYLSELEGAVHLNDLLGGLLKSAVFAVTITLISCQRGLSTRGGAAGVGMSTTSAVVVILFSLVVLDTLFTVAFDFLGI